MLVKKEATANKLFLDVIKSLVANEGIATEDSMAIKGEESEEIKIEGFGEPIHIKERQGFI